MILVLLRTSVEKFAVIRKTRGMERKLGKQNDTSTSSSTFQDKINHWKKLDLYGFPTKGK